MADSAVSVASEVDPELRADDALYASGLGSSMRERNLELHMFWPGPVGEQSFARLELLPIFAQTDSPPRQRSNEPLAPLTCILPFSKDDPRQAKDAFMSAVVLTASFKRPQPS